MALRTRKNQADLTSDERDRFVAAVKYMKQNNDSQGRNMYNKYVAIHQYSMLTDAVGNMINMWAHQRPGFPPWHRQLILDFENDLQAADSALHGGAASAVTLPYWDWINYHSKKKFLWWGKIWGDNFMGGDGDSSGKLSSGPFQAAPPDGTGDFVAYYMPGVPLNGDPATPFLRRSFGKGVGALPFQEQWDAAAAITTYDSDPWDSTVGNTAGGVPSQPHFVGLPSFRNAFEGWNAYDPNNPQPELHNKVHVWVGGSMGPVSSPNDPIFFLHHCNVDRLWAQWQMNNPTVPFIPDRSTPALTGPDGHNLPDAMPPWDGIARPAPLGTMPVVHIKDVLNHQLLGYRYDTDPVAASATTP